ncbi:uncharacterized protein B0I36DRAFT_356036 [Microdochium trichocladiopsis]|uniref:Uncharacterized protein n=1 Tax=Microdochium trichocladiopsis TaxID=1682393 RepID=A0A9P8XRL8_9PEZI|nr:uncharacterized protein B0I36DRAFT_356036 [Microdochium trichocladiopsis]KAH7012647.1 hypothetical protein B0I36DRAFT_356036 [Microdochium trichocladiopsis]
MATARKRPRPEESTENVADCPFTVIHPDPNEKEKKTKRRGGGSEDRPAPPPKIHLQVSPFSPIGKFNAKDNTMDSHGVQIVWATDQAWLMRLSLPATTSPKRVRLWSRSAAGSFAPADIAANGCGTDRDLDSEGTHHPDIRKWDTPVRGRHGLVAVELLWEAK